METPGLWRNFLNRCSWGKRRMLGLPDPYQPFGSEFGLTIYPEFVYASERKAIREAFVDTYLRKAKQVVVSDGRLQLPPVPIGAYLPTLERMEDLGLAPPGWCNNQTVNMYQAGDYIRAHIDNMFVYDDFFVVLCYGAPCVLKFVHAQSGEELEAIIPENAVYTMHGPSRYIYFHMILPVETQRLSIVLRRSILRTDGTFRPVCPQMNDTMPYKANDYLRLMLSKEIGVPRLKVDDDWMTKENLGPFDTGKWVKTLRPLRDWSLLQQLDEDQARIQELATKRFLPHNFDWRFTELRAKFKEMEQTVMVKTQLKE